MVVEISIDGGGGRRTEQDWWSLTPEQQWARAGYDVRWQQGWPGSALTAPRGVQPPWMPTIWKGPGAPERAEPERAEPAPWMQPIDWRDPWRIPAQYRGPADEAPYMPMIWKQPAIAEAVPPIEEPRPYPGIWPAEVRGAVPGLPDVPGRIEEAIGRAEEFMLPPEEVRPYPGIQPPEVRGPLPGPGAFATRAEVEARLAEAAQQALPIVARGIDVVSTVWGLVPEPVAVPVEKAVGGVLEFFGKFAPMLKRGIGVVGLTSLERSYHYIPPGATQEHIARRERLKGQLQELRLTTAQKTELSDSYYTWMAHPERLEKALTDIQGGATPLEVARKYKDPKAELVGELVLDPLFFAPIVTKPLSKLISGTVQGVKKFKPIAPLFELSKRSIVQVAKFDTVDIGKVIFKSGDDAKAMAKTLDSFLDDAAKFADDLRPRGQQQAESITELIKGSGLSGKKIIKKGMTRNDAVEAFAQATSKAAAKAIGFEPSAGRTLVQGAQQALVEHWLGTRPAWLVYNYADNTLKLAIEGVGPWFRLGPNLEAHIARYGDVPAQISAGFSKSITGMSDISMHEKVLGLPGKPVTKIFNKGSRMEAAARTRLYIHDFANIARGGRDDALRLIDDLLGPVDDATRSLIARDLRSIAYPNEENVVEAVLRYAKKKSSVTSARSFADDAGRIPDELGQTIREGLEKAKTPEDVAAVFDAADVRTVEEATEYMKRMGQPGDWMPYTSFDDVGGPSAVFAEGGEELIGFRPDLNHEIVGELANKVKINPKHARNVLRKINRDLGIDEGLLWSAAKTETGGESARAYWNYLLGEADKKNVVLPSWIETIDLVDEGIVPAAETLMVRPKEAALLPGIEAEAELAAGRPPEIAERMRAVAARELGIGPEEIDAARAAELAGEIPPVAPTVAREITEEAALKMQHTQDYIESLREVRATLPDQKTVFKFWDYRTGKPRRARLPSGELVTWEKGVTDDVARTLGYATDEDLIRAIEDAVELDKTLGLQRSVLQRLISEERGSVTAQPILDAYAKWRTSATDDLARAGETIEQSPEALRAIREYAKAAKKVMRATLDDAPIKASLKVNKTLGNYTERNKLSEMMRDIITFWDWPAYNIPYWGRTFMEKPFIPASVAKARAFTAAANEGLPDRLKYSIELPIPPELLEKVGFAPDSALYADLYRYASFMQQIPGGTPYQAGRLREAMDDPTSPESLWTIGTQMGYRTWPWTEMTLGAAGVLGDDWYPFDLSSYEPIARALLDTDTTPSSWLREKIGLEPNKFLEWQTQKEVRAQITRGEEPDWEGARTKARGKIGFLSFMAILGVPVKEFTAEEAERMGMTQELRDAVKADVERTGGDPTTMGYQEMWTWAKRHGATMKGEKSAINDFYAANPDYPDLPWESEEEWQVEQDQSAYFDETEAARTERDGRISDLAIPHSREALNQIWGDYFAELTAINEKYPNANITPSTDRPIEYLKDQTQQAMLRQLDETKPDYYATVGEKEEGERVYESYEDYSRALREWEAGLRATALELWGAETFSNFQHLATPEALEEYDKSHHTIARAAHYTWKKHIEPPFYEDAQWAQVSQLTGAADWENVTERIAQWSDLIETIAEPTEIDPRIIAAIIDVESGGNADAYNKRSRATGLMQVIPGEVFEGRPFQKELLDPQTNIGEGVDLLVAYLIGADYDLKDALYEYSGGSEWSSREAYEKQYWDRLSSKFKGLWGVSLGSLRAEARDEVMSRPMGLDVESLLPLIMMEYPGRWTPDEIRAELRGKDIMGVLEAQRVQRPDTVAAREASTDVWDTRSTLPPGVYRKALDELPEVALFLGTGENPKAALEAIEVYVDEHPVTGTAQEWAQAEREHDEFRRYVYNTFGTAIYEEQNAYYAAREEGRRVEPSERLEAYWDAHTQFRQEHPTYTQYYFPDWEPYEPRAAKAAAPRAARKPTKQEVLQKTSTLWKDFTETVDAALLELIQSWLLLPEAQRGWFLRRNPELAAWLAEQDPDWLGELKASLGAHLALTQPRRGRAWRSAPTLRWYRQWS